MRDTRFNMGEQIASLILFSSLVGMGVLLFRKISFLADLPETSTRFNLKKKAVKIKEKIKNLIPFEDFSNEMFLQKVLSKIRVLTLKTENQTANWLELLRQRSIRKKNNVSDNYWQELKTVNHRKKRAKTKKKDKKE